MQELERLAEGNDCQGAVRTESNHVGVFVQRHGISSQGTNEHPVGKSPELVAAVAGEQPLAVIGGHAFRLWGRVGLGRGDRHEAQECESRPELAL